MSSTDGSGLVDVFMHGQILGGVDFDRPDLYCKWSLVTENPNWVLKNGVDHGTTQTDSPGVRLPPRRRLLSRANVPLSPAQDFPPRIVWEHPVDVWYKTAGLRGWPALRLEVWQRDAHGRSVAVAYAVCALPTTPGEVDLECRTWAPVGTLRDQAFSAFMGNQPTLSDASAVLNEDTRKNLTTVASGTVHVRMAVLIRGLNDFPKVAQS